jgi:hypothetical protein
VSNDVVDVVLDWDDEYERRGKGKEPQVVGKAATLSA